MVRKRAAKGAAGRLARLRIEGFALSNLRPETTGVDGVVIWVSAGEFGGAGRRHGPRLLVVHGNEITSERLSDAVAVRLTDPPEVLGTLHGDLRRRIVTFVAVNRDVLLRHWRCEISTPEMLDLLRKV